MMMMIAYPRVFQLLYSAQEEQWDRPVMSELEWNGMAIEFLAGKY
jgi:hypothetical protein